MHASKALLNSYDKENFNLFSLSLNNYVLVKLSSRFPNPMGTRGVFQGCVLDALKKRAFLKTSHVKNKHFYHSKRIFARPIAQAVYKKLDRVGKSKQSGFFEG